MKKNYLYLFLICFSCTIPQKQKPSEIIIASGSFEGTEPFWSITIKNDTFQLQCANDKRIQQFQYSEKSSRGATYAFRNSNFYGIINRSPTTACSYAITEDSIHTYEIFFSYKNKTYSGCGNIKLVNDSLYGY